jgi:carbamate kinase
MRILAALGGNALLRRGEPADVDVQLGNIAAAVPPLASLAAHHELIITHGNGPQVGMLALESAADPALTGPYPLDTLDAEAQGMIGYWLARELENALPSHEIVALVTQTMVDPGDRAFDTPTAFVGPLYDEATAHRLVSERNWRIARDGDAWRRVVPSPQPREIVELPIIRLLVDCGVLVIAAGGGGVPVARGPDGHVHGVEAVVDKDLAAAVLAIALDVDMLLMLTDVQAVYEDYGTLDARPIYCATPMSLYTQSFPPGSMGPKVDAACRFVTRTGRRAAIGALADAPALVDGRHGTLIVPSGLSGIGAYSSTPPSLATAVGLLTATGPTVARHEAAR